MLFPDDLAYTVEHEWVRISGRTARVGITDHAQDALGDVVYVQLPDLDLLVAAGDAVADIESTKSVSAIYAPLDGVIAAVNDALAEQPELVNTDPYGEGWIFELTLTEETDPARSATLLDAAEYQASLV
jgi:glycine cleavage system H protein